MTRARFDVTASPPAPLETEGAPPEPTDDLTTDERWLPPRGPHLPDALGVLPLAAWIFVVLAVARLAWGLREADFGAVVDPWRVGQVVLFGMPSAVSILLPAALLTRHRDAPSRLRAVFIGVVLLASVEGLRLLGTPLEPFFEWLTPGDEAATFLVPSALAYQVVLNLTGAGAVAAVSLGLTRERRFADRSSSWPVSAVLAVLVVLVAVTGIGSVSRLSYEQLPLTPTVVAYIVTTVVLNVVSAASFGYLTATTTAGMRAGEDPARGWRFGALGAWLVIGSLATLGALGLVPSTPDSASLLGNVFLLIQGVFAVGFLALLGGFALGLPRLDPIADEDDGGASDADEEDARHDAGVEVGTPDPSSG